VEPDQVGTGVAAEVAHCTGVIGIGMPPVHRRQAAPGTIHPAGRAGPGGARRPRLPHVKDGFSHDSILSETRRDRIECR
jgi:hypothetical protein